MSHYKDTKDQLYFLDDDSFSYLLPAVAQLISDEEAKLLQITPVVKVALIATKYKFRLALNQLGLREAVETAVAASADQNIKDAWQYADEFRSDDPIVLQLGAALGKTEEDIRVVFELANTL